MHSSPITPAPLDPKASAKINDLAKKFTEKYGRYYLDIDGEVGYLKKKMEARVSSGKAEGAKDIYDKAVEAHKNLFDHKTFPDTYTREEINDHGDSFKKAYGAFYPNIDNVVKSLKEKMFFSSYVEASDTYNAAKFLAEKSRKDHEVRNKVRAQQKEVNDYFYGVQDPLLQAKHSLERMPTHRVSAEDVRHEFAGLRDVRDRANGVRESFGLNLGAFVGGLESEMKRFYEREGALDLGNTPSVPFVRNLNEAGHRIDSRIAQNQLLLEDLVSGKKDPETVKKRVKFSGASPSAAQGAVHVVQNAAKSLGYIVDRIATAAIGTRVFDRQPDITRDSRFEKARIARREAAESLAYRLPAEGVGDFAITDEEIANLPIGGKPLSNEDFNRAFDDAVKLLAEQIPTEDQWRKDDLEKTATKIKEAHATFKQELTGNMSEEDALKKFRLVQMLLLLSPFMGFAILPQIMGFLTPMVGADSVAAGLGQISTDPSLGFFSKIAKAIRLDDLISWLANNVPIISEIFDFLSEVLHTSLVKDTLVGIAPLVHTEVFEIAAAGAFFLYIAGPEVDAWDRSKTMMEKHTKSIEGVESDSDEAFEARIKARRGQEGDPTAKDAEFRRKVIKDQIYFNKELAEGLNFIEKNKPSLLGLFDDIVIMRDGSPTKLSEQKLDNVMDCLSLLKGVDPATKQQISNRFLGLFGHLEQQLVQYIASEYDRHIDNIFQDRDDANTGQKIGSYDLEKVLYKFDSLKGKESEVSDYLNQLPQDVREEVLAKFLYYRGVVSPETAKDLKAIEYGKLNVDQRFNRIFPSSVPSSSRAAGLAPLLRKADPIAVS